MKQRRSLTLRIALLFGAVSTTVLLICGFVIEKAIDNHFYTQDSHELNAIALAVESSLSTLQPKSDLMLIRQRFDDIMIGHHGPQMHIYNKGKKLIYSNTSLDLASVLPFTSDELTQGTVVPWSDSGHHYRVLIRQVAEPFNGPYTLVITVSTDFHRHFLQEFRYILWFLIIGSIIILALMGWFVARQAHRPLNNMVKQIANINAGELATRIDTESVPLELNELSVTFNNLIQRLEESFNQLSNFSADIAHELRTPITNLTTQTQVILSQKRCVEDYQETLYSNMEEFERMTQMINDMLFLAKTDNGLQVLNNEKTDLRAEVNNLLDFYSALAEESEVSLFVTGQAQMYCDRLMFRRALSNLLSNAIRHTPAGETISMQLSSQEQQASIAIHNPGMPIPSNHIARLFDRFYRVDPSRQHDNEGAGLGLSITKLIVELHGGEISVTSDELGTEFKVVCPISDR
jgi:two-component system heavy metal sensor histidine kinase CusS